MPVPQDPDHYAATSTASPETCVASRKRGRPLKSEETRKKRREIFASDAEWAEVGEEARLAGLTISRHLIEGRGKASPVVNRVAEYARLRDKAGRQADLQDLILGLQDCVRAIRHRDDPHVLPALHRLSIIEGKIDALHLQETRA